jgi:hypothetical protein
MTAAPHACGCCRQPIKGKVIHSCGVGLVCQDCGRSFRAAARLLGNAGMRGLYLGDCPDHRKGGLK